MKDPITLKSGAVFLAAVAPFPDGVDLYQTIARELAAVNFDISNLELDDVSSRDVNTLKNAGLQLVQSKAVLAILDRCLMRCLYNNQKIVVAQTFNPEDARGDYFPVLWEVAKVNLIPFFKSLDLSFLTNVWQKLRNQESNPSSASPDSSPSDSPRKDTDPSPIS